MINLCIADDEPIIRQGLVSLTWESVGVRVVADVANGIDAVEILQTEVIDVVLADIRMPGLDGIGLAAYIAQERYNTRVVLLSGHSDFAYAQRAIAHHVASYLLKPSSPDEILKAVTQAGEEVEQSKAMDLRLKVLEAELGKRQLVIDESGIVLGEVSHSGVSAKVVRYIVERYREPISLTSMANHLHFSSIYLSRVIKKATGYTFLEILAGLRVQEAARLLRESEATFAHICERVGAADSRYFGQVFKRAYGKPPSSYRRSPTPPLDEKLPFVLNSLRESAEEG